MNWKKIFLASIAVITLFGCDTGAPQVENSDGGVTKEEFASSRKESGENGDASEQKKQQLQDGDIPHLIVETIRRLEEEGNENAALYKELTYNYISLSETEKQKFSELSAALESLNSKVDEGIDEKDKELEDYIVRSDAEGTKEYRFVSSETKDYVFRADSRAVSILRCNYLSDTGESGDIGYTSFNFDTATGRSLKLNDVVADTDLFFEKLGDIITLEYGEEYEAALIDYKDREEKGEFSDLVWTVSQEGVCVYFAPKTLSEDISGEIIVNLYFDDVEKLFNSKYKQNLKNYFIPLLENRGLELDGNGDGVREKVNLEQSDSALNVMVGDKLINDLYSYETEAYAVKKNGKYYLYMFTLQDNDYVILEVIDLMTMEYNEDASESLKPVLVSRSAVSEKVNYYSEKRAAFVDTDLFLGERYLNILSTYSGVRNYKVGDDGRPKASDYYTVMGSQVIQANSSITCEEVSLSGEITGKAVISEGTYLMLIRTDGESVVDVKVVDADSVKISESEFSTDISTEITNEVEEYETLYRLNIDMEEWPGKINGVDVEELFTGMHYAG